MREPESYYSSLSEIKWFACYFHTKNTRATWQVNSSNRSPQPTDWDASVSERTPAYEAQVLMLRRPLISPLLN